VEQTTLEKETGKLKMTWTDIKKIMWFGGVLMAAYVPQRINGEEEEKRRLTTNYLFNCFQLPHHLAYLLYFFTDVYGISYRHQIDHEQLLNGNLSFSQVHGGIYFH